MEPTFTVLPQAAHPHLISAVPRRVVFQLGIVVSSSVVAACAAASGTAGIPGLEETPSSSSIGGWIKLAETWRTSVWQADDFLSEEECRHIITRYKPYLSKAGTIHYNAEEATARDGGAKRRANAAGFRDKDQDTLITGLLDRIHAFARMPRHLGQPLQVTRYDTEEYYVNHHDSRDGRTARALTFLIYLNDVPAGGETVFPFLLAPTSSPDPPSSFSTLDHQDMIERLQDVSNLVQEWCPHGEGASAAASSPSRGRGLVVHPRRGRAILWHNHMHHASLRAEDAFHFACPVRSSSSSGAVASHRDRPENVKWVAQRWITIPLQHPIRQFINQEALNAFAFSQYHAVLRYGIFLRGAPVWLDWQNLGFWVPARIVGHVPSLQYENVFFRVLHAYDVLVEETVDLVGLVRNSKEGFGALLNAALSPAEYGVPQTRLRPRAQESVVEESSGRASVPSLDEVFPVVEQSAARWGPPELEWSCEGLGVWFDQAKAAIAAFIASNAAAATATVNVPEGEASGLLEPYSLIRRFAAADDSTSARSSLASVDCKPRLAGIFPATAPGAVPSGRMLKAARDLWIAAVKEGEEAAAPGVERPPVLLCECEGVPPDWQLEAPLRFRDGVAVSCNNHGEMLQDNSLRPVAHCTASVVVESVGAG